MEINTTQIIGSFVMLTLLLASIFCIYTWSCSFPNALLNPQIQQLLHQQSSLTRITNGEVLESVLAKASMGKKTVIITIINKAYVEEDEAGGRAILDIFLSSFWLGEGTRSLIDNLVIVAVDKTAYDRCNFLRLNCFRLETDGVDFEGEKLYMTQDFINMMWARTYFLLDVLKRGYNFVFTDTDVMWLRNPFTSLSKNETLDLQISTDYYLGSPWLERHEVNTGFYFVRSNNRTISLFETWYGNKDNATGQKEQDVLQDLIGDGIIGKLRMKVMFLDTLYFSGFCQDSEDLREVITVHANCCRSITAKALDLGVALHDWKKFKKLDKNSVKNLTWSEHYACNYSWTKNNTS